jgi:ammonia channel protein AmtB
LYPIVNAWTIEGGWLNNLGFKDFAGASTCFMVGGVAGLCGTFFLGERYGKKKLRKLKAKKIEEIDAMRASIIFD